MEADKFQTSVFRLFIFHKFFSFKNKPYKVHPSVGKVGFQGNKDIQRQQSLAHSSMLKCRIGTICVHFMQNVHPSKS